MLFRLTYKLPPKLWVAVSGGVDSMAALHWLSKVPDRVLGVVHVNHNTGEFADSAFNMLYEYCMANSLKIKYERLATVSPKGVSKEAWWREERYKFFSKFDEPVVLAHNLDDCVEEYVMCMMVRGFRATIPYQHANCIRPFRLWERSSIEEYAKRNGLVYLDDPSNNDTKYKRNFIRHELLPVAYKLNPGLKNIVTRLIDEQDSSKYCRGIESGKAS